MVQTVQSLKVFNTLSGKKEEFNPIDPSHVKIYACGPTVYNYAHIGNARMAVVFDTLVRLLRYTHPKVTYVSNITDIDDKIIDAANELNLPIKEITEKYTDIYNEDMAKLSVMIPDIQPKATEYITEMIELIQDLITKEHAYEKEGHVLFHVPSYLNYGMLSNVNREGQIAGSRVDVAPFKKDPADFVLWKPSNESQPGWESPWGFGRPGWHTECSAMSKKTLGLPFDGFVTINGQKMSKSLGNIILVKDLSEKYHGEVIRLALLSSHYRQGLDWNDKVAHQAKKLLDKLYKILESLSDIKNKELKNISPDFISSLMDDLNTPGFLANLNKLTKDFNSIKDEEKSIFKSKLILCGQILGILQESHSSWFAKDETNIDKNKIEDLISNRLEARAKKDFVKADLIRKELLDMGIEIKDTDTGTEWSITS